MKIIITSEENHIESKVDMRFGRSSWFCVWDVKQEKAQFIENTHKNRNGGAGTKAAETVAELDADKVISGDFGPKAKSLLEQFNIKMEIVDSSEKTIDEIIASLKQ